jgi:beta-lactamase regulating signal transducer with metallopeptidase domain
VEALLSIALGNAVAAAGLAVVVAALTRVCRRPAVAHALWLLVLLKLLTPPLVPLTVPWPQAVETAPVVTESPSSKPIFPSRTEPIPPFPPVTNAVETPVVPEADPSPTVSAATLSWETTVLALWLCGSLGWWAIAGVRLIRFQRLLREAREAPESVAERARRLAKLLGLRRCPPVSFVAVPISPMLWALGFAPRLVVPEHLWQRLNTEQRDTLLAHELAHLRRGDHWVRRLELLVLGLYWWHPVAWWAQRRLQEAEEECCDAWVVAILPASASAYASALVEAMTFLSQARALPPAAASGIGHVSLMKRRLTMIVHGNSPRRLSWAGVLGVLGLAILLLPLAPGWNHPAQAQSGEPSSGAEDADAKRTANDPRDREPVTKKRLAEAEEHERAEQIENLQDEIELLKVQVTLKQALLEAAKIGLDEARRLHARMRNAAGSIPESEVIKARAAVMTHEAQIRIREAELKEPLVRLKQAERRLARLQRPVERPATDRQQQEQRLRELEKKLSQILEEMKALQREMHRQKPRDPSSR